MQIEMTIPQLVAFYLNERKKRWKRDKEEESNAEFGARRLLEIRIESELAEAIKAVNASELCEYKLGLAKLDISPPNAVKIVLGLPQDRLTGDDLPDHWLSDGYMWLGEAPRIMSPHVPWWHEVKTTVALDRRH